MNTRIESSSWLPPSSWWVLLAPVIAAGLVGNWFLAAGVLVVLLVQVARPFDFMTAFLIANGYAAFVHYEGGKLTLQFTILGIASAIMLVCYLVSMRNRVFEIAWSPLSKGVLLFLGLSMVNYLRGMAAGYPWKHGTSEILATIGLGSALLVANTFDPKRDLRLAFVGFLATGFASAALGFYIFSVIHSRTGGVYYIPVPGIAGLFLLNLALRSEKTRAALGWVLLSIPLFLHQFLSFRRGVWLGALAGLAITIPMYTGWGRGSGARWRRTGAVFGTMLGLALAGALVMALFYGQMDILEQAGGRFASIGGTEVKAETWSNIDRLTEYATVVDLILKSPWVGYGLGYTFLWTEPLTLDTKPQWWVHQNYLLIWLKLGVIGLALFIWLFWTATRLGWRESRRRSDPWESAWFATTAGATVCMAIFAMFDFPFAEVYSTYMMGLFWGGAIAMSREGVVSFRWSAPRS